MHNRGVTRNEVAAKLRVSGPCISNLLSGRNNLTSASIERLANAIGCEIDIVIRPKSIAVGSRE